MPTVATSTAAMVGPITRATLTEVLMRRTRRFAYRSTSHRPGRQVRVADEPADPRPAAHRAVVLVRRGHAGYGAGPADERHPVPPRAGHGMLRQAHAWAPLVPLLRIATVVTVASSRLSPGRQALLPRHPGQSLARSSPETCDAGSPIRARESGVLRVSAPVVPAPARRDRERKNRQ
jgi:hypothetical protein